jgi:4-hydroxy-3-methylbut-2-enyl diphosphate reductase IspH
MNNAVPEKLNKRAARFADTLGKVPRTEPLTLQINNFNVSDANSQKLAKINAKVL